MFDFSGEASVFGREHFFEEIDSTDVTIPIFDPATYKMYPEFRWMHNKMLICDKQNIWNVPDGCSLDDDHFPLFRKPIINIHGMSRGAQVVPDKDTYEATYSPGHFLMPVLEGRHLSIDVVVCKGKIEWLAALEGFKDENGSFLKWEKVQLPTDVYHIVYLWCAFQLRGHVGVVNLETIGTKIIECHLRMSSQTIDLNGKGWLEAVVELYRSGKWMFDDKHTPKEAYSIPIRTTQSGMYYFKDSAHIQARQLCSSVLDYIILNQDIRDIEMHDDHSYVLAVLNGFNLEDLSRAKRLMISGLRYQSPDYLDHPGDFCF